MLQDHQTPLQGIESFDVGAPGIAQEDLLLDLFELSLQRIEDWKIAIDHGVHERVEHVRRTELQQVRLALAPGANVGESALGVQANREDGVGADEDVDFSDIKLGFLDLDRLQYGKQ